jgi:hypothetical protein
MMKNSLVSFSFIVSIFLMPKASRMASRMICGLPSFAGSLVMA